MTKTARARFKIDIVPTFYGSKTKSEDNLCV